MVHILSRWPLFSDQWHDGGFTFENSICRHFSVTALFLVKKQFYKA